jgi:leader peptidase (prepilin peptidase)/N-methyltransferase
MSLPVASAPLLAYALLLTAALGLAVGSFLNVVVWRLPRGESLSHPGSHCPGCEAPVRSRDNVPVVSWVLLRGRCRDCGTGIGARYPLVEAATAALWIAVVAVHWGDALHVALGIALVTLMVPVVFIDLEHLIIPDRLTGPFAVLAVVLGLVFEPSHVPEQLIAGAAAGGFFLVAALAKNGGMGLGDVKLAGVMGLYLGKTVAPAIMIALVVGVVVGMVVIARKGAVEGRKTKIPFGPFLALGAVVCALVGEALMDAYLGTL